MKKTKFIFTLMLGCSLAAMAKAADTSYDNCVAAVGADNCHVIPNNPKWPTEGYSDTTYYALSGPEGNQTMTIYGTTGEGSAVASVPYNAFYKNDTSPLPEGVTSLKTSGSVNIRGGAFASASGLTSVDLTGVQSIGNYAFQGATGLTSIIISDSLLDADGNILERAERNGVDTGISSSAFDISGLQTIYCPARKTCANSFTGLSSTPTIVSYSVDGNGQIKAGGKTYASLDDLANGNHIKKRIYTLDEANEVTGTKNRVSIRYR